MEKRNSDWSKAIYWAWGMHALILIGFRVFLIKLNPAAPPDSTWVISPVFSVLRGEYLMNEFVGSNAGIYYHYLLVPFFALFKGKYSIFVFYELVKIALSLFVFKIFHKKLKLSMSWAFLIAALVFLVKEMMMMRPELVLGTLILVFHLIYLKESNKTKSFLPAVVFFAVLFLLHPIAAAMHGIIYVLLHEMYRLENVKTFGKRNMMIIVLLLILAFVYTVYSPAGKAQLAMSESRLQDSGLFGIYYFMKMSFPLFLALVLLRLGQGNWKPYLIQFIVFLVLITLIGGHYYYVYFLIFTLLDMLKQSGHKSLKMSAFMANVVVYCFLASVFLSLGHPCYVYSESRNFVSTTAKVFEHIEMISDQTTERDVYVDPSFAMPLLQNSNTKILYKGLPAFGSEDFRLKIGDLLLLTTEKDLLQLQASHHGDRFDTVQRIPFAEGVLSLSSGYSWRVNAYGLVEARVVK